MSIGLRRMFRARSLSDERDQLLAKVCRISMRDRHKVRESYASPGLDKFLGLDLTRIKAMMKCSNGTCLFWGLSVVGIGIGSGALHACLFCLVSRKLR